MRERLDPQTLFTPTNDPERYLEAFTLAVRHLSAFAKESLPDCRIILHKARWAEYYVDARGDLHPYDRQRQLSHFVANVRIKSLENVFESEVDCASIAVDDVPFLADVQHIWGFLPVHYQRSYYGSFSEKLRNLLEG